MIKLPSPLSEGVSAEGRRAVPSPLPEECLPKADGVSLLLSQRGVCRKQTGCPFPFLRGVAAEGRRGVPSPLSEGWLAKADGVFNKNLSTRAKKIYP